MDFTLTGEQASIVRTVRALVDERIRPRAQTRAGNRCPTCANAKRSAARSLLDRACLTANPFPDPLLAATAKAFCNEMAIRVTSEAVQIHGGFGYTDECAASRLHRAARYGSLGGGTTETLKDLIGRRLMAADEIF